MDGAQQRRNVENLFHRYDRNGNGSVGWDDFGAIVEALTSAWGVGIGSPQHEMLLSAFRADWEALVAVADKDHDARVSIAEWSAYQIAAAADDDAFVVSVEAIASIVLAIADPDGDGRIGRDDYGKLGTAFNLSPSDTAASFDHLDADHDGIVTVEEIWLAAEQFHRPSGPNDPGNWLFGPVG